MYCVHSTIKFALASVLAGGLIVTALQGGLRADDPPKNIPDPLVPLPVPNLDELRKQLKDLDAAGVDDILRQMQQTQDEFAAP